MTRSRLVLLSTLMLVAAAGYGLLAQSKEADVTARSQIDRTAMWVGDRAVFTVTLICRRQTDVLPEDLTGDKLKLQGLDVVNTEVTHTADGDNTTRYDIRYTVAAYHVDVPVLQIAPFDVRYFVRRPGQRLEDAAPAGAVQVPGAAVAFRSVLPEARTLPARDAREPQPRRAPYTMGRSIGIALLLLALAPLAILGIDVALQMRRSQPATTTRVTVHRQSRREAREAMQELTALAPATLEERRDAFARLDALVRRHVTDAWGVPIDSAPAAEASSLLESKGERLPASIATDLLRSCELALYGPPDVVPSSSDWREAVARASDVIAAG